MTARLLILVAAALPLAACAAAPAVEQPHAVASRPADVAAPNPNLAASAPASTSAAASAIAPASDLVGATAPAAGAAPATPDIATTRPLNPAPVTMPSGSPTGSLLQTLFALILVLGVLAALAWFLKRYGPKPGGGNANVRMIGSLNLGGRERVLVIEVGGQWIVLGASPGRINALATMPRQDGVDAGANPATLAPHAAAPSANNFADWLRQTIDKRK
jgi:flagellar biosynthetic protein FliO